MDILAPNNSLSDPYRESDLESAIWQLVVVVVVQTEIQIQRQ